MVYKITHYIQYKSITYHTIDSPTTTDWIFHVSRLYVALFNTKVEKNVQMKYEYMSK